MGQHNDIGTQKDLTFYRIETAKSDEIVSFYRKWECKYLNYKNIIIIFSGDWQVAFSYLSFCVMFC